MPVNKSAHEQHFYFNLRTNFYIFQIWAGIFLLVIVVSVGIQCGFTSPAFRRPIKPRHPNITQELNPKMQLYLSTEVYSSLLYIDNFCLLVFVLEIFIRFCVCPKKLDFFKSGFNWIDILSTSFMMILVVYEVANPDFWTNSKKFSVVYIVSAFSVFRVLRLVKYAGFLPVGNMLLLAIKVSAREIGLLVMLFTIGMLIFSNMIYYAEFYSTEDDFYTIPEGFWWAIVTMTTVGYGDKHPHSSWGYVVGAVCALVGLLCAALPIPIISNNFNIIYSYDLRKRTAEKLRRLKVKERRKSLRANHRDSLQEASRSSQLETIPPDEGDFCVNFYAAKNPNYHGSISNSNETAHLRSNST